LLEHRWILGPEDRLPWPPGADEVDYQVEVACIVGQFCRDVSPDRASEVIFGYTLMNDWAERTHRTATGGRARRAKVDRFATSLGPCIVTSDEFDPGRGRLLAKVDGEVWSEGELGSARGTFPQLLAEFSRRQEMYPGDVLGSGTFPGGCALDRGLKVTPGSVVELETAGIGRLRNRVGYPEESHQPTAAEG
jgi:2-keto-4-pentenoate hydratase/2-oxohepta-3-ene-1,7-dioic acid hydratase in catechol pathway